MKKNKLRKNDLPKKSILSSQIDISKFAPATDEEKRQTDVMSESVTFFKDGMRRRIPWR